MRSWIFKFLQEYFKLRSAAVAEWKARGETPYPHKFHVSTSLTDFIEKYENISPGEILTDTSVSVAGKNSFNIMNFTIGAVIRMTFHV